MLTKEQRKEVERLARQMRAKRTVAFLATQTSAPNEIDLWRASNNAEAELTRYLDTITES